MTLPYSGPISLLQIRSEFGGGPPDGINEYYRGVLTTQNNQNVPAGGAIAFSQFYGAVRPVAGALDYQAPGTYSFVVPPYVAWFEEVWGAGGGGGGSWYDAGYPGSTGGAGGYSYTRGGILIGYGGQGGISTLSGYGGADGAPGSAACSYPGAGLSAGGGNPGGGGGIYGASYGTRGGAGGLGYKWWNFGEAGAPAIGSTISCYVGTGGYGGGGQSPGAAGSNGRVYFQWY
jgi:hypothetical protein